MWAIFTLSLGACVDHGAGPGGSDAFEPDPSGPQGPDVGDNGWPDGVYGRVLSYFESAGQDSQVVTGAVLETDIGEISTTSTRSGRYQLDVPEGTFNTVATASGFRRTHQASITFLADGGYEKNLYLVTDTSVTQEAQRAGVAPLEGTGFVIAHLVDEDTGLAEENATLANITLTDLDGTATGLTVYGIGTDGRVDPAATTTVRNEDGNAAVVIFNVPPGDYYLNYNGGQADIYSDSATAHVADLYVP